jgi:hypothetical protein
MSRNLLLGGQILYGDLFLKTPGRIVARSWYAVARKFGNRSFPVEKKPDTLASSDSSAHPLADRIAYFQDFGLALVLDEVLKAAGSSEDLFCSIVYATTVRLIWCAEVG